MGLEYLKRWHWMVIGLLVGAMFGATRVYWREPDSGHDRSFDRDQFIEALSHGMDVRNLVLHPPLDGQDWVTGEWYRLKRGRYGPRMTRARDGKTVERPGEWTPFPLLAAEVNSSRPGYRAPATAEEYLANLNKFFPRAALSYTTAWWEIPRYTVGLYAAAGLVLIGGVWPTILNLLAGAGFGRQRKEASDYDLSRFQSTPEPAPTVVQTQAQQLAALNAELEQKVADMILTSGQSDLERENEEEAKAIRQLQSQSTDPAGDSEDNAESKEYKGEFYPVVKPGHQDKKEE